jgi:hypothetical protein
VFVAGWRMFPLGGFNELCVVHLLTLLVTDISGRFE